MATFMQLAMAPHLLQCVRAVCVFKIPDLIHSGLKTAEELAKATGLHTQTLYRVVRATSLAEVVSYDEQTKSFSLLENGQLLRSDHPQTLRPSMIFLSLPFRLKAAEKFDEMMKTGVNCMTLAYSGDFFDYCKTHPEDRQYFDEAMTQLASTKIHTVMSHKVPLDGVTCLLDVGGGHGTLVKAIVARVPHIKAISFDLPEVVNQSPVKDHDPSITLVGGNFFKPETFPKGADGALLATVLHDWSDEHCVTILKNVRSALPTGGKLFISEHIISNTPGRMVLMDIEMLWLATGRERSKEEYSEIAGKAGFRFKMIHKNESEGAHVLEYVAV